MALAGAAIIGGATLLAGYLQSEGSKSAASTQTKGMERQAEADRAARAAETKRLTEELGIARDEAIRIVNEKFGQTEQDLQPFISGGKQSYRKQLALSGALGPEAQQEAYNEYQESPGVEFQRQQGVKGLEAGLSAKGGLGGGSRLKALSKFNQGLALQNFDNQYNKLTGLTKTGVNAATNLGSMRGQAAGDIGRFHMGGVAGAQPLAPSQSANISTVQAQNQMNQANIQGNTINQLAGLYGYYGGNQKTQPYDYSSSYQPGGTGYPVRPASNY